MIFNFNNVISYGKINHLSLISQSMFTIFLANTASLFFFFFVPSNLIVSLLLLLLYCFRSYRILRTRQPFLRISYQSRYIVTVIISEDLLSLISAWVFFYSYLLFMTGNRQFFFFSLISFYKGKDFFGVYSCFSFIFWYIYCKCLGTPLYSQPFLASKVQQGSDSVRSRLLLSSS